ncbi:hypothetical protein JCM10908_004092 [Rhodotorula pacifica]|uniref:cytochrome b5 reductase family protein n=1 Tax=Rhodotorula pacifica TaxID=1495444 RepID=UPI00316F636B
MRDFVAILSGAGLLTAGFGFFALWEEAPTLGGDRWTAVKIKSVTPLTPETSLFRLEVPKSVLPPAFSSDPTARPILSLYVKEPSLQIQRAYTPLTAASFDPKGPAELDLVVKRYPDGELSRYMHRLGPGSELNVRGPSVTWWYRRQDWDEVVFVVGGTGITPAYQFVHDMLRSDAASSSSVPRPAVSIIYASPSPSRVLLKKELDSFTAQDPAHVSLHYLVDRPDAGSSKKQVPPDLSVGFIERPKLEKAIGAKDQEKRRVVVVCGPEGMVEAVAGPRGRNFSQGRVGGILQQLGYTEKEVVEL